ncbi:nucleotidyltransferase family protein [Kitasatospora phosalacinea]|uniref:4-diphosphocytidyl-2C-methyl-D-erythritol synthase n=1 Tax=Kitasatospora phosalacinea TaxID=2065 RepID=A0A9W6PCC7_9ACTN|nr:nucleotidyltransferase family protein [Kitasatospora phosalacinea]GLW52414.1 4-diphosphocytidyl-2C-methyl-D-erythritol synthase [Kitasatospora phosalacinea]
MTDGTGTGTGTEAGTGTARLRVPALVLAAGGGSRLGGRPKALLRYRGRTLLEHALAVAAEGGCAGAVAVLGAAAAEVRAGVRDGVDTGDCRLVDNPDWRTGMASSLRAGLAALPPGASAVLVLLVDTPGVTAEAVRRLLAAHAGRTDLASCAYAGRRAHPVLIGAAHFPFLLATASGDAGARALLASRPVTLVDCTDAAVPDDLDTPADLARWGVEPPGGGPGRP